VFSLAATTEFLGGGVVLCSHGRYEAAVECFGGAGWIGFRELWASAVRGEGAGQGVVPQHGIASKPLFAGLFRISAISCSHSARLAFVARRITALVIM
jgi:hypothetical protein